MRLAQSRPQAISESVEKAAVAVSRRQGEWGVDGAWSYDFSEFGYACAATSHSGAKPDELGTSCGTSTGDAHDESHRSSERGDVLKAAFDRVLRAGNADFRVLDLGAGSGAWLAQARKELREHESGRGGARRSPVAIHLHGVTGDALPSEIRAVPSQVRADSDVKVAYFQQVGIETFPLRLGAGADITAGAEEPRAQFARTVEAALAGGPGYDLIVSSWMFCHLIDPLATLETWSNALALGGEIYLNDIDFLVSFEDESAALFCLPPHSHTEGEDARGDSTGGAAASLLERDPEKRMARTFEALNAKGAGVDGAFSLEFIYDEEDYRTAVKMMRLTAAPIRFAPVVGYHGCMDSGGRLVYSTTAVWKR